MALATIGTLTRQTEKTPTRVMEIAENGKAVASLGSVEILAVPSPCELDPIARPLATGSWTLKTSSNVVPKLAPSKPVTTANDTPNEGFPLSVAAPREASLCVFLMKDDTRRDETRRDETTKPNELLSGLVQWWM